MTRDNHLLRRGLLALLAGAAAVGAAACLVHIVNLASARDATFGLNFEQSVPTYASAAAFAAAGVAALFVAAVSTRGRAVWLTLAALGLLFASEEAALDLHARAEEVLPGTAITALIVLTLGALAYVLLRGDLGIDGGALRWIVAGAVVLALSQVFGVAASFADQQLDGVVVRDVLATIEECGEIAVGVLMVAAAWIGLEAHPEP